MCLALFAGTTPNTLGIPGERTSWQETSKTSTGMHGVGSMPTVKRGIAERCSFPQRQDRPSRSFAEEQCYRQHLLIRTTVLIFLAAKNGI